MTTHDYPGETNAPTHVDPTTASTNPGPGQADPATTADPSTPPTAPTDPDWQRQADQFAADRGERAGAHPSPAQADPASPHAARPEDVDGDTPSTASRTPTDSTLFADTDLAELRRGWDSVQAGFVDDPK